MTALILIAKIFGAWFALLIVTLPFWIALCAINSPHARREEQEEDRRNWVLK
jgi:hypothetical protein